MHIAALTVTLLSVLLGETMHSNVTTMVLTAPEHNFGVCFV